MNANTALKINDAVDQAGQPSKEGCVMDTPRIAPPKTLMFPADMAEFVTAVEKLGIVFSEIAEFTAGENMIPTVTVPVGFEDGLIIGFDTYQWNGETWIQVS